MKGRIVGYNAKEVILTIRLYTIPQEINLNKDIELKEVMECCLDKEKR